MNQAFNELTGSLGGLKAAMVFRRRVVYYELLFLFLEVHGSMG